jgi:hypothetical protein
LIQNNRYFFTGLPTKYALVGREDRHVWLVLEDKLALAHFISHIFNSKITTDVFDLTTFENFSIGLVDNSVCFDWQVPGTAWSNISVLDIQKTATTVHQGTHSQLENIINHDILLLSPDRCQELQMQMMLIHQIYSNIQLKDLDLIPSARIQEIVAVNLDLAQIEAALYDLANEILTNKSLPESAGIALNILDVLQKIYE